MQSTEKQDMISQLFNEQQNIARLKKLYGMLAHAENYRNMLIGKCESLKAALEKENADLLKLEGKSFSTLAYSVLGTLDKHIDKEKGDVLAVKMKYDQAQNELQYISGRIAKLTAERESLSGCQQKYDSLFAAKRQMLLEQRNDEAERVLELERRIGEATISLKEIGEAKTEGNAAREALAQALQELNTAEDYSAWDIGGGGMLASAMKHEYIDGASQYMAEAQVCLERFKEELGDVDLSIDTNDGLYLTDVFFDNVITDLIIQSRISKTKDTVGEALEKVKQALITLDWIESEKKNEFDSTSEMLNQVITYG